MPKWRPKVDVLETSTGCEFPWETFQFSFSKFVYYTLKSQLLHILSVSEKRPQNVLKTSQSDTRSVTSLDSPQDINLGKYFYISWCHMHIQHCRANISSKPTSYFGFIMVGYFSTKIGPLRDVFRARCAGWVIGVTIFKKTQKRRTKVF